MEDNNKLRLYIVRTFLLTILFIAVAQFVINIILNIFVTPMLENILGLEGTLLGMDSKSIFVAALQIFLILAVKRAVGPFALLSDYFFQDLFQKNFDYEIVQKMYSLNEKFTDSEAIVYILIVATIFIIIMVLWLFPYIAGALVFAKRVSGKIHEVEKIRQEKEREMESQRNLLLSDIAHDIKTPITTMAGFSRALLDGTVEEEHRNEYLSSIYTKSMQVSELVTLLFEYVKMDSAGFKLSLEKTDLCELLRKCVGGFYTEFEERGIELSIDIPDEPVYVNADILQLGRAINNIIVNTLKHNPEMTYGEIILSIKRGMAVLEISDNGVKIETEVAKHLFDPFVQGDYSRKSGKGTGLGLSITKKIVNMHNGKVVLIQYQNREKSGKTKTFEVTLPVLYIK